LFVIVITVAAVLDLSLVEIAASLGIVVAVLAVADRTCGLLWWPNAVALRRQFGSLECRTR